MYIKQTYSYITTGAYKYRKYLTIVYRVNDNMTVMPIEYVEERDNRYYSGHNVINMPNITVTPREYRNILDQVKKVCRDTRVDI